MSDKAEIRKRMRAIEREVAYAMDRILRFGTDGQITYYQGLADEYANLEKELAALEAK